MTREERIWYVLDAYRSGKSVKYKEWYGWQAYEENWGSKRKVTDLDTLLHLLGTRTSTIHSRFFVDGKEVKITSVNNQ